MNDLISRRAVLDWLKNEWNGMVTSLFDGIKALPPAHQEKRTEKRTETHSCDCISRQAAVDTVVDAMMSGADADMVEGLIYMLPSAQPERRCVNCGRTVNNGGWYEDGRTRCPIEEHYALPKDGYCHLWEKRNVTDDDYPERREE